MCVSSCDRETGFCCVLFLLGVNGNGLNFRVSVCRSTKKKRRTDFDRWIFEDLLSFEGWKGIVISILEGKLWSVEEQMQETCVCVL